MSHQTVLQPIVLTPQVKKAEPRKSRLQSRAAASLDGVTAESFEAIDFDQTLAPENFVPIAGIERKPYQPQGRLSDNTLKAMLQVQEFEQQESGG
jgi:electron transfer flavoprotein alpha/beta subunit